MEIKDTLKAWMAYYNTDPTNLAAKVPRLNQSTIQRVASGETSDPRRGTLLKIAEALGITLDELEKMPPTGGSESVQSCIYSAHTLSPVNAGNSSLSDAVSARQNVTAEHNRKSRGIPVLSWITAGELCDTQSYSQQTEPEFWIPGADDYGANTYALKVSGNSMYPEYHNGWYIYVDPDRPARHGDDVVASTPDGGTTFKRLHQDGDSYYLEAINKDWPERIIKMPPGSRICGVVVGAWIDRRK